MTPRLARPFAICLTATVSAWAATQAQAEMRQCSDQRVEYLVGGAGKAGARPDRTCGSAVPAVTAVPGKAGASVPAGGGIKDATSDRSRIAKPDDEGRRDILDQELRKERLALAELDRQKNPTPGAGSLDEQRVRLKSDIAALESELGRLKPR